MSALMKDSRGRQLRSNSNRFIHRPIRVQLHVLGLSQLIVGCDFVQHILDVSTGLADDALAALESIGHAVHVGLCVYNLTALDILNPNMERIMENLQVTEGDEVVEDQPQTVKNAPKSQLPRSGFATSWK